MDDIYRSNVSPSRRRRFSLSAVTIVVLWLLASGGGINEEERRQTREILDSHLDELKALFKIRDESRKAVQDGDAAEEERNFAQAKILRRKSKDLMERYGAGYEKWINKVKLEISEQVPKIHGDTIREWLVEHGWEQTQ